MSAVHILPWAAVRKPDGTADVEAIDIWLALSHGRTSYITDVDADHEYVESWFRTAHINLATIAVTTGSSSADVIRSVMDKGRGRPLYFDTDADRIADARQRGAVCVHLSYPSFTPDWRNRPTVDWETASATTAPPRSSPDEDRIRRS